MRRLSAFLICLAAVLALFASAGGETVPDDTAPALASGTLTEVRCTDSGDEYGNIFCAIISRAEDGTLVLTVEESPTHEVPLTISRYAASGDTLQRIADIVNTHDMTAWAEREDDFFAFDASHPYLVLEVLTKEGVLISYSISGFIDFSDDEAKAYDEVWTIVEEHLAPEFLLETYTVE